MSKNKIQKNDKTFFKKLEENSLVFDSNKIRKEDVDPNQKKDIPNKNLLSKRDLEAIPRADFIPENISTVPMQKLKILVFCACIVLISVINFTFYQNYQTDKAKIDKEINSIDERIKAIQKEIADAGRAIGANNEINEKIKIMEDLSREHIYWTKALNIIQVNILEGSIVRSISVDPSGVISLSMGSKSYKDMAAQGAKFKKMTEETDIKKRYINEVKLSAASSSGGDGYKINYSISLEANRPLYTKD